MKQIAEQAYTNGVNDERESNAEILDYAKQLATSLANKHYP